MELSMQKKKIVGGCMVTKMRRLLLCCIALLALAGPSAAQIDVDHVISIGRNALYFNDYVVSISYFNRVVDARPWMAEPYLYRAIAKVSLDDYVGANDDATLSLERNPYISKSYLVRGVSRQNLKRYAEAAEDYQRGLSLAPDDGQMRYNLAVAELKLGRLDSAERTTDSLLYYNPKLNAAYALRAAISLERQDTTLALQRIAEAIRIDPMMSLPYRLRGSIAARQGQWHDAIRDVTEVLNLDGDDADLYAQRAILLYQSNNLRGAMADYTKALALDRRHKVSRYNRALLRQQVGERSLALEDWNKYLELDSTNYIARYNRAVLIVETGQNLQQAVADLDAVVRQYPSFADGLLKRAILKRKLGDRQGAEDDYWRANELIMNKRAGAKALAQARSNQQKATREASDQAIDKYAMLIEGESSSTPDARYSSRQRGRVQDRDVEVTPRPMLYLTFFSPTDSVGDISDVETCYSEIVDSYNRQQGGLALRLQSTPMALSTEQIQQLTQLLQAPEVQGEVNYYIRRGIAHSLLQDYEQAILDYNKALALDGRHGLALLARSIASMRYAEAQSSQAEVSLDLGALSSGRTRPTSSGNMTTSPVLGIVPSALQDLGQLIMLHPKSAAAYYNRAVRYTQAGDKAKALADYTHALEQNPSLAIAYYNRGLLLLSEGKTDEGISDLSKAGELGLYDAYNLIKRMH